VEEKKAAALNYESGDYAPRILARGAGATADAICRIAQENCIPIVKSSQLVHYLSDLNPFEYVPKKYWAAVAEILSLVYETRGDDGQYKS